MATAHIRFGNAMGGGAPAYSPIPSGLQTITATATSQASTIRAVNGDYARIVANGGNLCFAVGAAPVAVAASGDIIMSGTSIDLGPLAWGDKVAVIDA